MRGRFLSHFPLFYSYLGFVFCGSAASYYLYRRIWPEHYAAFYWVYFLITLLAEFAVLVEASDHIFKPYPPICRLARFLTLCVCATFFLIYIVPSFMERRPSSAAMLDLVKRVSLTKAVIILMLLVAARYYRLPLGENISGMLLGFSLYLATNIANFTLAEKYGRALYFGTFVVVLPLSYTLSLLVWTIALWRYEPALTKGRATHAGGEGSSRSMTYQLGRFNTTLAKLLRK
jgi:hypothetical protein